MLNVIVVIPAEVLVVKPGSEQIIWKAAFEIKKKIVQIFRTCLLSIYENMINNTYNL
jgi:hypothetical protein